MMTLSLGGGEVWSVLSLAHGLGFGVVFNVLAVGQQALVLDRQTMQTNHCGAIHLWLSVLF